MRLATATILVCLAQTNHGIAEPTVLAHAGPWPPFQLVDVFVEFIWELLSPRSQFLPNQHFEI